MSTWGGRARGWARSWWVSGARPTPGLGGFVGAIVPAPSGPFPLIWPAPVAPPLAPTRATGPG